MAEVNMEQLLNCALCPNMCRCECPVLQVLGREAVAPAGKARLAALAGRDQLNWTPDILEAVSNCLACRGCSTLCPFPELNLCDELLASRLDKKAAGIRLAAAEPYLANLKKYGSPYGQKPAAKAKPAGSAEILFFAGCTSPANHPASVDAALSLFTRAGVSWTMVDEDCCGYPAETWGNADLARQLAGENLRKFEACEARAIVTNCPECWLTFTDRYPRWGLEPPLPVIDGPSYFLKLIKEGRLEPSPNRPLPAERPLCYHDPCIWARAAGKVDEPRAILSAITGLEPREARTFGENTRCCGGGAMFQLSHPETAAAVAGRRLEEFPAGATIVTACPFCREGLHQEGREVLELVELLDLACR